MLHTVEPGECDTVVVARPRAVSNARLTTHVFVLFHDSQVLKPGLVKGPWSATEDQIIRNCVESGITSWVRIADHVPGRVGKQCRERWYNHLVPGLKKTPWTAEEDATLLELMEVHGECRLTAAPVPRPLSL